MESPWVHIRVKTDNEFKNILHDNILLLDYILRQKNTIWLSASKTKFVFASFDYNNVTKVPIIIDATSVTRDIYFEKVIFKFSEIGVFTHCNVCIR